MKRLEKYVIGYRRLSRWRGRWMRHEEMMHTARLAVLLAKHCGHLRYWKAYVSTWLTDYANTVCPTVGVEKTNVNFDRMAQKCR